MAWFLLAACARKEESAVLEQAREEPQEAAVTPGVEPGVALVCFDDEMTAQVEESLSAGLLQTKSASFDALASELGIKGMRRLFPFAGEYEPRTRASGLHRWYVVDFDTEVPVTKAQSDLLHIPGVECVEPSRIIRTATVNDTYFSQMWGLNNSSYPGYDVNVQPVWEKYTTGNPNVTVAVIDGGIPFTHPDLKANIAASGHYNYVSRTTTITQHTHGTHVAGTIAAVSNNGIGVAGIAGGDAANGKQGVKLLSLQVFETYSDGSKKSASSFATALKEAADRGAIISQNSWGYNFDFNEDGQVSGYELNYARSSHENPERSFTQAVDYFNTYAGCDNAGNQLPNSPMKGGVVIFAAGNDNIQYGAPGNYDGCVSVGALAQNGSRASFSNYGDWVDICAPGVNIISTYTNNSYARLSGTSMACPHVSGVAALVVSCLGGKGFTAEELRNRLLNGARSIPASTGSTPIGPLADAEGAIMLQGEDKAPDAITSYTVEPVGHNLSLAFTANDAYGYMVMAGRSEDAVRYADPSNPGANIKFTNRIVASQDAAGTPVSVQLMDLDPNTEYFVAIAAYSYSRKFSALSPIKRVTTNINHAPEVTLPDNVGSELSFRQWEHADIPVLVSDPDGDAFTIDFQTDGRAGFSSQDGSAGNMHFTLMCPLVQAPASFKATLVVTDELGARTVRNFSYSVAPNVAPVQLKEFTPQLLTELGQTVAIDLSGYFTDEDGEPLDFRAASMDGTVVTTTFLEDGSLQLKAVGYGSAQVKVQASDADGKQVSAKLPVLVRSSEEQVSIYPGTQITGQMSVLTGVQEEMTTVVVISSSGVEVFRTTVLASAFSPVVIDLSACAPGYYTVIVSCGDQTTRTKILKL